MKYKTATAIIVSDNGKILLTKRARDPFRGQWALPSGVGESKKGIPTSTGVIEEVRCDLSTDSFRGDLAFTLEISGNEVTDTNDVYVGTVDEAEVAAVPEFSLGFTWADPRNLGEYEPLAFEHGLILQKYLEEHS